MQIHYTTDGSEPTENSRVWTGNIQFSETTILRARVLAEGHIPGAVLTQSYIFSNRDFTLPVVSVVTDPKNLWDDEIGIYCVGTNGIPGNCEEYAANWNREWDRPANIEIIGESKQLFSQECDIAIGGKCSRMSQLKTLKLNAEKKFDGRNHFLYPFFQAKPGLRYKSLYLRNSGGGSLMRDAMQQCLLEGVIDIDYQAYQPTIHFINGEYYGIINLRERNNHHFIYSNYGYDKDSIDLIGLSSFAYYGSFKEFEELAFQTANAADPDVYKDITEKMDIDEFITYFITEIYVGNSDWPDNNFKNFRHRKHGKWRWLLYDLDAGFTNLDANTFERLPTYTSLSVEMLLNLAKNESFRQRFIDYFTICMGSVFHPERVHTIIDSLSNQIWSEVPYHQEKFYFDFEKECQSLKEFASKRGGIVLEQIKNFFELKEPLPLNIESNLPHAPLFMNEIKLPLKKMEGHTFKGNELRLKAIAPTGYRFERWKNMDTDHVTILQSYFESEITITAENALNMQAEFIKEGNTIPAVHINEVSASNNIHMNEYYSKEDWIELYNSSDTPVSIAGLYLSSDPENLTQYRIPDTPEELTVIPPFGYRILWADKMEDLTQLHLPFKLPAEGATLQLSCFEEDAEGIQTLAWSNQLTYPPHTAVQTFGRYPDGGSSTYTMNRNTFAAPNFFSLHYVEDPTTSIQNPIVKGEDNGGINIYYNPSSAILTIETQTESTAGQSLAIYNLLGQPEITYSIPAHQNSYIIDLSEINSGYHIAVLRSSDEKKTVFKFIK